MGWRRRYICEGIDARVTFVNGLVGVVTSALHIMATSSSESDGFRAGLINRDTIYRFSGCRWYERFCDS